MVSCIKPSGLLYNFGYGQYVCLILCHSTIFTLVQTVLLCSHVLPSRPGSEAYDTLVNLFKDGKLDATTAMKMMAGISESATPKTPTSENSSVPKASQGSNTGFRKKRSHEEDQSDDDAASDDMELEGSKYSRLDTLQNSLTLDI